jgi:hypothetical protein
MVEAVAVILALLGPSFGRWIKTGLLAALPLANSTGVAQETVLVGLDAQAVEEFRVELHGPGIMGSGG